MNPSYDVFDVPLFTRHEAREAGYHDYQLPIFFTRVLHGYYTSKQTKVTHALRCRAAARTLPGDSVITGRSAATLLGLELAGVNDPVEVLVKRPTHGNRRAGIRSWVRAFKDGEHVPWGEVNVALPNRIGFDLLSRNTIRFGVANCDALLRSGLTDEDALREFISEHRYYGWKKAWRALDLTDARSESIPESVLRVNLVQAKLYPTPQVEVYDANGIFVGRLDLAFEEERVAVEYDGAWHGSPEQQWRDLARRQRLRECGWTVIVVTADELYNSPDKVVARVRSALRGTA